MVKRKRLGKGLEDISHYFISSDHTEDPADPEKDRKKGDSNVQAVEGETRCQSVSIVDLFDPHRGARLTSRIGIELSKNGIRTLLIDADTRFPGIAYMLGLSIPGYSFLHYSQEKYKPSDFISTGPSGLKLLAPRLNIKDLSKMRMSHISQMFEALISVEGETDVIILRQNKEGIATLVERAIFIIPALQTSMIRAYREIKAFIAGGGEKEAGIIITGAPGIVPGITPGIVINELSAVKAYDKIAGCMEIYSGKRPYFCGYLPDTEDEKDPSISSLISHICKIGFSTGRMIKREDTFFERLRLLIRGDNLTGEEIVSLLK